MTNFRKGVIGIFISNDGQILLGERSEDPGMWQLPQGGVEPGESTLEAIKREIFEEVGIKNFNIIKQTKEFISYRWHPDIFPNSQYIGQEHIYFLIEGDNLVPTSLGPSEEFSRFKWVSVEEALKLIVEFKKSAYVKAFI